MGIRYETRLFTVRDLAEVADQCEHNKQEVSPIEWPLDVDPYSYLNGNTRVFVILNDDDEIKGYSIFRITEHPHHQLKLVGYQDVTYIHPDYRKGIVGLKFYKYIEKELSEEVHALIISHTFKKDLSPLFKRMGYNPLEISYIKEI
jgi:hypothetical protein